MNELRYEQQEGCRLDVFLTAELENVSRSRVAQLIKEEMILVNGKKVKAGYRLEKGDIITYDIPEQKPLEVKAEDIPLDIVYEDHDVIVVNKPRGMVVHPAPGTE